MNDHDKTHSIDESGKQTPPREPILNIPPMTQAMLLVLLAVHIIRLYVLDNAQDTEILFMLSFIPARVTDLDFANMGAVSLNALTAFTYMLFHIGWSHFLLNTTSILAFGTAVEKFIGGARMLGLFIICGLAGIVVHYVAYMDSVAPVVGASAAASGLFGAVLKIMQYSGSFKPGWKGLLPIVIIWTVMNIVFGIMGMPDDPTVTVAWLAHIGGFLAGIFGLPLFLPARLKALTKNPNFINNAEN